jgi:ATP-dependent Lon protease
LLALFPLPNVVLFPGMMLPLHIFEERYIRMIHDLMPHKACFGIQLCQEYDPVTLIGKPFEIGTVADILESEFLADGHINLMVIGISRFRAVSYDESSKPYLQGDVVPLEDTKDRLSKKLITETIDLFQEALRLTHKVFNKPYDPPSLPEDPEAVSFFIAENLRGSLVLKQELLEMTSIKARLSYERDVLGKMVKALAVRSQIEDAFRS